MKWTKENKERLCRVVWEKFRRIYSSTDNEWESRHLRSRFFMEFGILRYHRPMMRPNSRRHKGRVIIPDPWSGRHLKHLVYAIDTSLSIPEDIAEKFLILGVP